MGNVLYVQPINVLTSWIEVIIKKIRETFELNWTRVITRYFPWETVWKHEFEHRNENRMKMGNTDGIERVKRLRKFSNSSSIKKAGVSKRVDIQNLHILYHSSENGCIISHYKQEILAVGLSQSCKGRILLEISGETPSSQGINRRLNHDANELANLSCHEIEHINKGRTVASDENVLVIAMEQVRNLFLGLAEFTDLSEATASTSSHLLIFNQSRRESGIDKMQDYFLVLRLYLRTASKPEYNRTDPELADTQLQEVKEFRFPRSNDTPLEPSEQNLVQVLHLVLNSISEDAFHILLKAGILQGFTTERFGSFPAVYQLYFSTSVSFTNTSDTRHLETFHVTQDVNRTSGKSFDLRIFSSLAESFIKKDFCFNEMISFMASKETQMWMFVKNVALPNRWNRKFLMLPLTIKRSFKYRNSGKMSEIKKQEQEKKIDKGTGTNYITKRKFVQVDGSEIATTNKKQKIGDDFEKKNDTPEPSPCTDLNSSSFSVDKFRTPNKMKVYHEILNNVDYYSTLLHRNTSKENYCIYTALYEYIADDKVESFFDKIICDHLERSKTTENKHPTEPMGSEDDCTDEEDGSQSNTKTTGKSKKHIDTLKLLETEEFWKEYKIQHSPGDGHCLLHSVMTSAEAQTNFVFKSKTEVVIRLIGETVRGSKEYKSYMNTDSSERKRHLFDGLYKYVFHHNFNTFYGDIVPHILANSMKLQFLIIEKNYKKNKFFVHVAGKYENERSIILYKTGMHYNAIVPIIHYV